MIQLSMIQLYGRDRSMTLLLRLWSQFRLAPNSSSRTMVIKEATEGLQNLLKLVEKHSDKDPIYVMLSGEKSSNGSSWCPDCVAAEPVVEKALAGAPENSVFIYCSVGGRATWKDPANEFRTHPKVLAKGVPTLLQWGTAKKLGDKDCSNEGLVKMFFEED